MATSDDPPFLSVGTEVSAKYRGAFCEATVKVAKKQVKCKVAYRAGQTAVVSNDIVKGPLKVGTAMEVRQQDGQYLPATILKLTDNSIYTVVFDDGDERTLKRSSLCLKGGRHFHESESLDKMPLTDPENFGTPVLMQSMKRSGRRKRRPSQSSVEDDGLQGSPVKKLTYPDHLPVGKCVFLENDRRRSCWFPAVVVPSHYVQIDESDPSDDTVCIRSFKDGRFYAAKESNLHEFSPSKEPLLSMLEGDVQSIYMCKPAIERAMAYLDTGELPWDMQLFENKRESSAVNDVRNEEEEPTDEQKLAAAKFYEELKRFQDERGISLPQHPSLAQRDLDLCKLYKLVRDNGGMEKVSQELKWRSLYMQLGMPPLANSSYMIKQAYKKYLYAFEMYEKAREEGRPQTGRGARRRVVVQESDEDIPEDKSTLKLTKIEPPDGSNNSISNTTTNNNKSMESSDQEAEASSSNEEDSEDRKTGILAASKGESADPASGEGEESVVSNGEEFCVNDRIHIWYGRGKTLRTYEAKILEKDRTGHYYVHYNGWNTRYDEWVEKERIAGKIISPAKGITRPSYKKKPTPRRSKGKSPNASTPTARKAMVDGQQQPSPLTTTPTSSSEDNPFTNKSRGSSGKTNKRRRYSSSVTDSAIGESASSPILPPKMASPFSDPPSYPTSSERHSPPLSPSPRVPPILSPDDSHESFPMRVLPESTSSSNPSSEGDQVLLVKKEENASWQPDEDESPVAMDTSPSLPEKEAIKETAEPVTSTASPSPVVETKSIPTSVLTPAIILSRKSVASFSPPSEVKLDAMAAANILMAAASSNAYSEPSVRPVTCEEDSSSSSSPSMESEREQTPPLAEEELVGKKCRRNSPKAESTSHESDESEAKKPRRVDLDFSINIIELQELDHVQRVTLVQERMKAIQKKYLELKAEVTYLDRKKRRARRREREVAKTLAQQHQEQPSAAATAASQSTLTTVQCH